MYQKKLKDEKKDRHWSFLLYVLNTIDYVKKHYIFNSKIYEQC